MLSVKTIACPKCGQLVNINADETFSEEERTLKRCQSVRAPMRENTGRSNRRYRKRRVICFAFAPMARRS